MHKVWLERACRVQHIVVIGGYEWLQADEYVTLDKHESRPTVDDLQRLMLGDYDLTLLAYQVNHHRTRVVLELVNRNTSSG